MKKPVTFFIAVLILLTAARPTAAGGEKYTMGFLMALDLNLDSQYKNIFEEVTPELSKRLGVDLQFKLFSDEGKFLEAAKKGELSIAYSMDPGVMITLMAKNGFVPFATYTMYGKKKMRWCVYTSKTGPYKSVGDLKGARMLFSPKSPYLYMKLQNAAGQSPMEFFHLKSGEGPSSNIYALSLGETDAVFGSSQIYDYFKMINPGPVKNLQETYCSDELYSPPMVRAKNMPLDVIAKLVEILITCHKDKMFKKYQPLMNMAKMRFIPIAPEDYAAELALYAEIEKKGISREYRQWERLTLKK